MSKLDSMTISQIISKIGLCLLPDSLNDIWEEDAAPQKNMFNPQGISVSEELKNKELLEEIANGNNMGKLAKFLLGHECEINKAKFVLSIIRAYKQSLEGRQLSPEKRKDFEQELANARNLLKDVNQTFLYYEKDEKTGKMDSLTIVNTKDESRGIDKTRKSKNAERLKQIEAEIDFLDIIAPIPTCALEQILTYPEGINREITAIIEYNVALDELGGNVQTLMRICESQEFENFINIVEQAKFTPEINRIVKAHIEAVDIDKLLLCAGIMYLKELEEGKIAIEDIPKTYQKLQVIQNNIRKNSELQFLNSNNEEATYDSRTFSKEMLRFITTDGKVKYLTIQDCTELREKITNGTLSVNSLQSQEFEALLFSTQDINSILQEFPNNYIFFLKQGNLIHSKELMLKNIINSNSCSQELLKLLCEKTDITHEEIHKLFDIGIISASDMESIKDIKEHLISDAKLFEKYTEYKDAKDEDKEKARIQLEKYALAYRKIELLGKTDEELEKRGEEFVETSGDDIEPKDLIHLYGLDIIPLKVAVDWGGEDIIENLLQTEKLKPADARNLRDKGLLDEKVLARLFKNNANMSYAYQVALVCTVFDGQTPEEQKIKQELAQYYHIENGMFNSENKGTGTKRGGTITGPSDEPQQKVKMRDPGAKYNLLSSIDKGVKIEEGIADGHIIFHYPNVDGGTVLIEKLHKIKTDRETGLKEIKADNSAATYIISEEEFIEIKSALIQAGKIDRTQLTQRWHRVPGHWIAHIGKDSWERGIKERFDIDSKNPRYSLPEDLARMEKLLLESAQSKDLEDR